VLAKQKEKVRARWLNKQMLGSNIATLRLSLKLQPVSIPWTVEGSIVTNQSSYSIKASGTTAGCTYASSRQAAARKNMDRTSSSRHGDPRVASFGWNSRGLFHGLARRAAQTKWQRRRAAKTAGAPASLLHVRVPTGPDERFFLPSKGIRAFR